MVMVTPGDAPALAQAIHQSLTQYTDALDRADIAAGIVRDVSVSMPSRLLMNRCISRYENPPVNKFFDFHGGAEAYMHGLMRYQEGLA